jgi:hypothetical protein
MERIREMARQLNIDMVNQGIACLPEFKWKYSGSITRVERAGGNEVWVVRIKQGDFRYQKTFANQEQAIATLRDINIREGFEIKNQFTVFENRIEVQLTQGRVFKCDPEDLHIIEKYVWGESGGGYVTTKHGQFTLSFHNLVMDHIPTKRLTVDHIDRNHLNCCKSNLRLVHRRTQSINRSIGKNNTSGIVGVYYD